VALTRVFRGLVLGLLAFVAPAVGAGDDPFPGLARAYLVLHDDRVLWSHADTEPVAPASLTKLMTALIAAESGRLDAVTTVTAETTKAGGSAMGLAAGDRIKVRDLLSAAMIASANDACRALAVWHSGSEAKFVVAMNRRAAELGLRDTRFRNACGFDAAGHLSTAADLAALASAAMKHDAIASAVKRIDHSVTTVNGRRRFTLRNRNALIGRYAGAIGVKTGYTQQAGPCVIALAVRGGHRVMLVLLGAKNRWWDAHTLLDRAFAEGAQLR
jgi:D-alanyl-D-alanine carboxypeptidase (penicillin-binding protein 5/6)